MNEIEIPPRQQFTLAEAAELVGRSPTTLRHHVSTGRLRATLAGKTWLVTSASLVRYVRDIRRDPPRKEG